MNNPYDTLGVPKDATPDDIKQAFRRKAKAHHPDREGGSARQMAEVNKAYDTLGDKEKRKRYDETGSADAAPTVEQEATGRLAQLFAELLEADVTDVVQQAHGEVDKFLANAKKAQQRLSLRVAKLLKARDRVTSKTSVNMYHHIVDGQIDDTNRQIQQLEHAVSVMSLVRQMLADYESDAEVAVAKRDDMTDIYREILTNYGWR